MARIGRSTRDTVVRVYKYDAPYDAVLPELGMDQLKAAHWLRNELVAVEYRYQENIAEVWKSNDSVAEAHKAIEKVQERIDEIVAAIKKERIVNQSTIPRSSLKNELKVARTDRTALKASLKEVKAQVKEQQKPLLEKVSKIRDEEIKEAVRHAKDDLGLYWGTYNSVLLKHRVAVERIREEWKAGRPAQRRFKRWDGTGTLHTQIMWQTGKPKRTPEVLATPGNPWWNVFRLEPIGRRHANVWVRIASGTDPVCIPVVIDGRWLPEDVDVCDVEVTRYRIGPHYRLSVCITAHFPALEPIAEDDPERMPVGVTIGWLTESRNHVRVARINNQFDDFSMFTEVPEELKNVIVSDGVDAYVIAPNEWRERMTHDDDIREIRAKNFNKIIDQVVEALRQDSGLASALEVSPGDITRWQAPGRLVQLLRKWPEDHPLANELEQWRKRDKHLWCYEANERRKVADKRKDTWRKVAAWIVNQASVINVDVPDVGSLRQIPGIATEDSPIDRANRKKIQVYAPGDLAAAIKVTARREGVTVKEV